MESEGKQSRGRRRIAVALLAVGLASGFLPQVRAAVASPWRFLLTLGSEVSLARAVLRVETPRDYRYAFSPLQRYLDYERTFIDFDSEAITALADEIAEETAFRMLLAADRNDVREAELELWRRGEEGQIMLWVAELLRAERIVYTPESLLSRAFDPELHGGEFFHLDCDLITHFFAHVGLRLDLDVHQMNSPLHAYVAYEPPNLPAFAGREVLYVEPTSFRTIELRGGEVHLMGRVLDDDFFIEVDYHRSGEGGVTASRAISEAAGYYQPSTSRDVEDSIASNVLAGMMAIAEEQQDEVLRARIRGELRARLPGTRHPNVVNNLYLACSRDAGRALERGDRETALELAQEARRVRLDFAPLMLDSRAPDRELLRQLGEE